MNESVNGSVWGGALDGLMARVPSPDPGRLVAGWVGLGNTTWTQRGWVPQLEAVSGSVATGRGLMGWVIPDGAVGGFVRMDRGGQRDIAIVLQDGSERMAGSNLGPLVWMLRRATGLPSCAASRSPWTIAVSRMLHALVDLARETPDVVLELAVAGDLRRADGLLRALGPLSALLGEDLGWEELRVAAAEHNALARWCDADMFGFLCGHGYQPAAEILTELEALLGSHGVVLIQDQISGPW